MLGALETGLLEQKYKYLMAFAGGYPNDEIYACILSSWQMNMGVLPRNLGLKNHEFSEFFCMHFPTMLQPSIDNSEILYSLESKEELDDVYNLLLQYRAGITVSEIWMAKIIATACQGSDHLWQDMGLWSRSQLSQLLKWNFPKLAIKNVSNMKWKKFIYKQLCITEGIYICRAPSCEACADYYDCFSAEE